MCGWISSQTDKQRLLQDKLSVICWFGWVSFFSCEVLKCIVSWLKPDKVPLGKDSGIVASVFVSEQFGIEWFGKNEAVFFFHSIDKAKKLTGSYRNRETVVWHRLDSEDFLPGVNCSKRNVWVWLDSEHFLVGVSGSTRKVKNGSSMARLRRYLARNELM